MKSTYTLPIVTCLSLSLLAACQPAPLSQPGLKPENPSASARLPLQNQIQTASTSQAEPVSALVKIPASGEVRYDGQTLTVKLQLPPLSPSAEPQLPFQTQLLDLSPATKITATVKDSYGKSYTPVGADGNGQISYPANGIITLTFNNVRPDELLIVEAQVTEASPSTLIPQADLALALRHTAISNVTTGAMDFQSTAVAKILKALLILDAARARAISLPDLESLMQTITGRSGSAPNYTYAQNHPSLVRTSLLATALQTQTPAELTGSAASYRGLGARIDLTVSGLLASDKLQVQLTDAATGVLSDLGNGTGFSLTGATPGNNLSLKVSPFGTPSRTYTYSLSPGTLPALTEGGSQAVTISAVPAQRILFVKANATGSNNGSSWSNAYTDLQSALAAAVSGDEIWIAAGTYKPHASDPNISFVMKDGIKLYGGFAGNESTLASRNFATNKVILSGDIDNNDNMSGDYNANYSGNTRELIGYAGRSYTLDGVTLQGANGAAMGMGSQGTPTVRNVIFRYNTSVSGGGAIYYLAATPILENLVFEHNLTTANGGGAIFVEDQRLPSGIPVSITIKNAIFYKNRAQGTGAEGGAINFNGRFRATSMRLTNVAFAQNSAATVGGALMCENRNLTLRNVSFAQNTTDSSPTGIHSVIPGELDGKNVLFWRTPLHNNTLTNAGNFVLPDASTPYRAAGHPAGPDGLYFTDDDGLQLTYAASDAINAGVNDDATIPALDILGRSRIGNHESGAYEYLATDPPTLSAFSPGSGTAGTSVTITGTNLSDTSAVRFNGVDAASFTVDSNTQITAIVPAGASTGLVTVVNHGGSANSTAVFTAIPTLSGFTPATSLPGTAVVITGTGFTGATAVRFNGTDAASFTVSSPTSITATVPAGATSGPIQVITPGGTASSSESFAVAVPPTLTAMSPAFAERGSTVTLTGTHFTGVTAVRFNGMAADFTVNDATSITATVPATAIDGAVSVTTPGGTVSSSVNFDVRRVIYVKANATGGNTGLNWANAYTSLRTALSQQLNNDQIWIAAGTYKPDASNVNSVFNLGIGAKIYGGFNGTETALSERNPAAHVVILSGDLQNNDNYTSIPFTNSADNSNVVVYCNTGSNALLDGVTITGAKASGVSATACTGMMFNNIRVSDNIATNGGGISLSNTNLTITNSVIRNNFASSDGGGMHVRSIGSGAAAQQTLTVQNVVFDGNRSNSAGAVSIDGLKADVLFERVAVVNTLATEHYFSAHVYNPAGTPVNLTLKNVLLANNQVTTGSMGMRISSNSSPTGHFNLYNVTVAENTCAGGAGLQCNFSVAPPGTVNNVLSWKTLAAVPTDPASGNLDLGTTGSPFLNLGDPDGQDNIWFTADDGFNLESSATAAIDQGISGGQIPNQDIAQRNRAGTGPEPGAYEYIP